jgi:hypothetical protein
MPDAHGLFGRREQFAVFCRTDIRQESTVAEAGWLVRDAIEGFDMPTLAKLDMPAFEFRTLDMSAFAKLDMPAFEFRTLDMSAFATLDVTGLASIATELHTVIDHVGTTEAPGDGGVKLTESDVVSLAIASYAVALLIGVSVYVRLAHPHMADVLLDVKDFVDVPVAALLAYIYKILSGGEER